MFEDTRLRADQVLCRQGLAASRERAQALIEAGLVFAAGIQVKKSSQKIEENILLEVRGEACPYVSRGGFKLEKRSGAFLWMCAAKPPSTWALPPAVSRMCCCKTARS